MHILITDSGVGGLSVVAYAERFVRTRGFAEPVRLTFANASPANDYGYNSMPTRADKLATFDRFLRNVTKRFSPDAIYVACNTLSVLLPDTPFMDLPSVPVKGIVETGVQLLLQELSVDPLSVAMIFGTQTTIDAGTHAKALEASGIATSRIVTQACPGLADTISEDREGAKTKKEIRRWVEAAVAKMSDANAPVVAALACTHYGYRKNLFEETFNDMGIRANVINPNESAVSDVFGDQPAGEHREGEVHFVTRYAIPPATIEALSFFLEDISPRTVEALKNYEHVPDLF